MSVAEIASALSCGSATVKRVKARYRAEGWLSAITAKKAPGRKGLDVQIAKLVVATACTPAPDGAPRWTIRMLSKKMKVPKSCVQRILAADGLKPWREKNVVHSEDRSGVSATTI
jgi:transposase